MNIKKPNKGKCPTCGEETYGESILETGDVFYYYNRVIVVVDVRNGGCTFVDLNTFVGAPVSGSQVEYKNLFRLSQDFDFPTPLGKLNDFLKAGLKKKIERKR